MQTPDLIMLRDLLVQAKQDLFELVENAHAVSGIPARDSNPGAIVIQVGPPIPLQLSPHRHETQASKALSCRACIVMNGSPVVYKSIVNMPLHRARLSKGSILAALSLLHTQSCEETLLLSILGIPMFGFG